MWAATTCTSHMCLDVRTLRIGCDLNKNPSDVPHRYCHRFHTYIYIYKTEYQYLINKTGMYGRCMKHMTLIGIVLSDDGFLNAVPHVGLTSNS